VSLTRDPLAAPAGLHPGVGCVEFPLHLLDDHLTELEQRARSEQLTVGQMIRRAVDLHLAGARERGDGSDTGDTRPDMPPDGSGAIAVTLLFPAAQLAELEALAARRATPMSVLIRRIVHCSLLGRSPDRPPPNES
jgi:hypothetical protein